MRASTAGAVAVSLLLLCGGTTAPASHAGVDPAAVAGRRVPGRELSDRALLARYVRPRTIPSPADNAITPARVALGRMLFFDPRLSDSRFMSCASCHNPGLAWADGNARGTGQGMRTLARRTPTVLDLAWASALFWDGRAETLEQQALGPVKGEREMNLPLEEMERRLAAVSAYKARFDAAYPGEPLSARTVGRAIATFERTIVSGEAPFDRWVAGDDAALSPEAKAGFRLFNGKASCAKCHSGWRFTDDSFHDIGVASADSGRGRVLPEIEGVLFAFKTPTLRNVAERYPYMHDGSEASLEDVVDLYDRGGRVRRASIADEIRPLHLSPAERHALVAFLRTLTSRDPAVQLPALPR
jgi:cytochrome c peroxidase